MAYASFDIRFKNCLIVRIIDCKIFTFM